MDSITHAKGSKDFKALKGNLILKKGGSDKCIGV